MRLTVVTPLFPPDVHAVATYHKELVTRLAEHCTVHVLLYGHLPEDVPKVHFTTVDKRKGKVHRLIKMFQQIFATRHTTDCYLITNGPSTELPALLVSFFTRTPLVLLYSDNNQTSRTGTWVTKLIHTWLQRRVQSTLTVAGSLASLTKPEIHPLITSTPTALADYEQAWSIHLANLRDLIFHDTNH